MEHIEKLASIDSAVSPMFVDSALRFYAEYLVRGEPDSFHQENKKVSHPGKDNLDAAQLEMAKKYIDWHDGYVAQTNSETVGLDLSETQDNSQRKEVDAIAEDIWKKDMQELGIEM